MRRQWLHDRKLSERNVTIGNADRYLKIVNWALRRYTDRATGRILISIGGRPSIYSRIEAAAFRRYSA